MTTCHTCSRKIDDTRESYYRTQDGRDLCQRCAMVEARKDHDPEEPKKK